MPLPPRRPGLNMSDHRRGNARVHFTPALWRSWLASHNERQALRPLPPLERKP